MIPHVPGRLLYTQVSALEVGAEHSNPSPLPVMSGGRPVLNASIVHEQVDSPSQVAEPVPEVPNVQTIPTSAWSHQACRPLAWIAALERPVRRLDEGRLSRGQELVKEVAVEMASRRTTQRFRTTVGP